MVNTDTSASFSSESLLQTFLTDERFWPREPESLSEAGLSPAFLDSLVCKHLALLGTASGRTVAEQLGLPFRIAEGALAVLRTRQWVVHSGAAPFNDYYYVLTEEGQERTRAYQQACG